MKNTLILIAMVFLGQSALAGEGFLTTTPKAIANVEVEDGAQVLEIRFESQKPVSCPRQMDLIGSVGSGNQIEVTFDESVSKHTMIIQNNVSQSCSQEINTFLFQPKFTCLNYGHNWGTVYIRVSHLDAKSVAEILYPLNIEIVEVNQLK